MNQIGKIYNRKPTLRQKSVAKIILANHGKMSISKAMRQAGYSESMARNPQYLTRSPIFQDILEKTGLSDEFLAKTHFELLHAITIKRIIFKSEKLGGRNTKISNNKIRSIIEKDSRSKVITIVEDRLKGKKTAIFYAPDEQMRACAIELTYRLKGYFSKSQFKIDDVQHELTSEEKDKLESMFKKG